MTKNQHCFLRTHVRGKETKQQKQQNRRCRKNSRNKSTTECPPSQHVTHTHTLSILSFSVAWHSRWSFLHICFFVPLFLWITYRGDDFDDKNGNRNTALRSEWEVVRSVISIWVLVPMAKRYVRLMRGPSSFNQSFHDKRRARHGIGTMHPSYCLLVANEKHG